MNVEIHHWANASESIIQLGNLYLLVIVIEKLINKNQPDEFVQNINCNVTLSKIKPDKSTILLADQIAEIALEKSHK